MLNKPTINRINRILARKPSVLIVTHWSPDGDAIGSSLGLFNYLRTRNLKSHVITPNDYPHFLHWMPGNKHVTDFQKEKEKAVDILQKAQVIFCLDFNSLKRMEELGEAIGKSKAVKIMIDHHPGPDTFADHMLHDTKASSTAELVYHFIVLSGGLHSINKNIASCLYAGIMTDTGSFRFPSTSSNTHRVVGNLIDRGADHVQVHSSIYDDNTDDKMRLLGYSLNKIQVIPELKTAWISLSDEELKRFNYKKGDTEGFVNYGLSIKGVVHSAFFVERDGKIKTSFRSKGNFDVNAFARKHFNGGGHRNASGGSTDTTLQQAVDLFLQVLPSYAKELKKA